MLEGQGRLRFPVLDAGEFFGLANGGHGNAMDGHGLRQEDIPEKAAIASGSLSLAFAQNSLG